VRVWEGHGTWCNHLEWLSTIRKPYKISLFRRR